MALSLKQVRNFLYDVRLKWYDIGIELEVPTEELDVIKSKHEDDPAAGLREMVTVWLKDNDKATWDALAEALESKPIKENNLATEARKKAQSSPSTTSSTSGTKAVNENGLAKKVPSSAGNSAGSSVTPTTCVEPKTADVAAERNLASIETTPGEESKPELDFYRVPTLENIVLIKWTDDKGAECRFNLFDKVSSTWEAAGMKLGTSNLDSFKSEFQESETRFMHVMEEWIDSGGNDEYPHSWEGLIELLTDVEKSEVATELTEVLKSKGITLSLE